MRFKLLLAALALPFAVPADAALAPGAKAPDFTTRGALAGEVFTVKLSEALKKGPVVLYFFPAAFTSGCNVEAQAFAAQIDQFKAAGASVIGMSSDTVEQLQKFSTAHCAGKFPVASAGPKIIQGYDVASGHQVEGRDITSRTSYVIAPDSRILFALTESGPAGHIRGTLAAVQQYKASRP